MDVNNLLERYYVLSDTEDRNNKKGDPLYIKVVKSNLWTKVRSEAVIFNDIDDAMKAKSKCGGFILLVIKDPIRVFTVIKWRDR